MQVVLRTKASTTFSEGGTYLIAGGLGGLGRSIAKWMVQQGAQYLILLSRSGPRKSVKSFLENLKTRGARVETPACDITDKNSLQSVLDHCARTMPPIKGCIQASMVLSVCRSLFIPNLL